MTVPLLARTALAIGLALVCLGLACRRTDAPLGRPANAPDGREQVMSDDQVVDATGTITRVAEEDVDKSGRNPKYFDTFFVRPDTEPAIRPAGRVELPPEIPFRIKDRELLQLTKERPGVGERWSFTGRCSGARPEFVYVAGVRKPR